MGAVLGLGSRWPPRSNRPAVAVICALGAALAYAGPAPPSDSDQPLTLAQARTFMVELINRDRRAQGLAPVALDVTASRAAQPHTDEMVEYGYSSHWGLDGKKPDQRYTEGGGTDADAENEHYEYNGAEYDPAGPPPEHLNATAQPTFTREEITAIEAKFMGEKPGADGHRQNILNPTRNRVGIALSRAEGAAPPGGEWATKRLACTQEFIDHYGTYGVIPKSLKAGESFDITGKLVPGYQLQSIQIRPEALAQPMSLAALWHTGSYSSGSDASIADYFPSDAGAMVAVREGADGESFSAHITSIERATHAPWPNGLYYVTVWAHPPQGPDFVVSQRTVMFAGPAATLARSVSPAAAISTPPGNPVGGAARSSLQWTAWIINHDTPGHASPVQSRKGCRAAANANGTHDWTAQFENSDRTAAYSIQFQLVPPSEPMPPMDWPARASTFTIPPAGAQPASASHTVALAGDCSAVPHIYLSINRVNP